MRRELTVYNLLAGPVSSDKCPIHVYDGLKMYEVK